MGLKRGRGCARRGARHLAGGCTRGVLAERFKTPLCGGRRMPRGVTALSAGADACKPWGEPSRPGVRPWGRNEKVGGSHFAQISGYEWPCRLDGMECKSRIEAAVSLKRV